MWLSRAMNEKFRSYLDRIANEKLSWKAIVTLVLFSMGLFLGIGPSFVIVMILLGILGIAAGFMIGRYERRIRLFFGFLLLKLGLRVKAFGENLENPPIRAIDVSFSQEKEGLFWFSNLILLAAIIYLIITRDLYSATIVFLVLTISFIYRISTAWRASRGLLGNNSTEALELIEFISRKAVDGGVPPGASLSRQMLDEVQSANETALPGVRA